MKTSTASHTLRVARTGLTIAAFALASCAAGDLPTERAIATIATDAPAMNVMPGAEQASCTGYGSHTLFLEDTGGSAFRLVHVRGCGWKYVGEPQESVALHKLSFSPVALSQAETPTAGSGDPLAVFIDGPTGYTFAWTGEAGWKFIGSIVDETH